MRTTWIYPCSHYSSNGIGKGNTGTLVPEIGRVGNLEGWGNLRGPGRQAGFPNFGFPSGLWVWFLANFLFPGTWGGFGPRGLRGPFWPGFFPFIFTFGNFGGPGGRFLKFGKNLGGPKNWVPWVWGGKKNPPREIFLWEGKFNWFGGGKGPGVPLFFGKGILAFKGGLV